MTKKNDVTYARTDFSNALEGWQRVDDVCAGEDAIKDGRETYLPKLNALDKSKENTERYERYLERAVFYPFTARTLDGMVGTVFKKEPSIQAPPTLAYVKDNIDGQGISLVQQSKDTLSNVMKKGRHALYVDFPATERPLSAAEMATGHYQATIKSIPASAVRNWKTTTIGSKTVLSLIVIEEELETDTEDGFGTETEPQYRVLRLKEGVYQVEIWRQAKDKKSWEMVSDPVIPKKGSKKSWDRIPFTFVGAENNDSAIDKAPLLDLANLNIAHFRNSADYEDSVFFCGQVQPYITELDVEWRNHMENNGIHFGSRNPMLLPKNSKIGMAQAEPNTLAFEAMTHKEDQAKGIGARLLEKGLAVKTATEAQSDNESEHSVLSLAVSNVNDAYLQALSWVAEFMNAVSEDIEFSINRDFLDHKLDPQVLTALVGAWQTGELISNKDIWAYLRKVGLIDSEKTDEEIADELATNDDGLGLDDDDDAGEAA